LNGEIASDLVQPLTPPNHPNFYIFVAFNVIVVGEHRDFIFGMQVDHSMSHAQAMDDKLSLKGEWSRDSF